MAHLQIFEQNISSVLSYKYYRYIVISIKIRRTGVFERNFGALIEIFEIRSKPFRIFLFEYIIRHFQMSIVNLIVQKQNANIKNCLIMCKLSNFIFYFASVSCLQKKPYYRNSQIIPLNSE